MKKKISYNEKRKKKFVLQNRWSTAQLYCEKEEFCIARLRLYCNRRLLERQDCIVRGGWVYCSKGKKLCHDTKFVSWLEWLDG